MLEKKMLAEMRKQYCRHDNELDAEQCFDYILSVMKAIVNAPGRGIEALPSIGVLDQYDFYYANPNNKNDKQILLTKITINSSYKRMRSNG